MPPEKQLLYLCEFLLGRHQWFRFGGSNRCQDNMTLLALFGALQLQQFKNCLVSLVSLARLSVAA